MNHVENLIATYYVVVSGDLNGDGLIGDEDLEIYDAYIGGEQSLLPIGSALFAAADIDNNGVVDEVDKDLASQLN